MYLALLTREITEATQQLEKSETIISTNYWRGYIDGINRARQIIEMTGAKGEGIITARLEQVEYTTGNLWRCSNCKRTFALYRPDYNYCPVCGAVFTEYVYEDYGYEEGRAK